MRLAVVFEADAGELKASLADTEAALDGLRRTGRQAANDIDGLGAATRETATAQERGARGARDYGQAQDRATDSVQRFRSTADLAVRAAAALGVALGAREIIQYADSWTLVQNRLRLVTDSTAALAATQGQLFGLAQATRSDFASTATLYSRLAQATTDLNLSHKQLLLSTTAIQQSFRVSGATAEEATNAVIQLSQALASGVFRGDEFNSVMEAAPRLAQAMTDALGVTRGELRDMAAQGQLTAETVLSSLSGQAAAIQAEFGTLAATVGDAFRVLNNAMGRYIGEADQGAGASAALADAIIWTAENFELLANSALAAGVAIAAMQGPAAMAALAVALGRARDAMLALNVAVRANPLGLLAAVAAGAIAALVAFSEAGFNAGETADRYREHLDRLTGSLGAAKDAQDALTQSVAAGRLAEVADELRAAQADMAAANREILAQAADWIELQQGSFGTSTRFAGVAAQMQELIDRGGDATQVMSFLQREVNAAFAAGDDALGLELADVIAGGQAAVEAFIGAEQEVLSLQAEITRLNTVLAEIAAGGTSAGQAIAQAAAVAGDAWTRAYAGIVAVQEAASGSGGSGLADGMSQRLAELRALREAAASGTIELDALTGAFVVNDRAGRVAAEALKLMAENAGLSRDAAEALAGMLVDEADAIQRTGDALSARASAMNEARQAAEQETRRRRQAEQARLSTIAGIELEIAQTRQLTAALRQAVPEWDDLAGAWRTGDREVRVLSRQFDILSRSTGITAEEARRLADEWVDATDAQSRAREEADRVTDALNDQAEAARHTGDEIQDAFGDVLETVIFDWDDGFSRLMESWARQGARTAWDLAATFARSLDLDNLSFPELGGVNIPGIPGGSIALAGLAGSQLPGNSGLISGAAGIAGGLINGFSSDFGSRALSWGIGRAPGLAMDLGLAKVSTASPFMPGVTYAPTGFGNALAGGVNSAGFGVLGSTAMQLLGFQSRNPYVGMGLTTAGSIAGGAAGTAIGASIGGTLGAAGGPAGAVIGAALAQVLSSQIGGRPSVGPNAAGHLGISGDRWTIGGVGSDNGGDLSGVSQQLQNAATALNGIMDALQLSIADPGQNTWRLGLGQGAASPYSATSAEQLVQQVLAGGLFQSGNPDVQRVLDRSGGSVDPASFTADLTFAAGFQDAIDQWAASTVPASAATRAAAAEMDALRAQIESFRSETERLGLDSATAVNVTREHVEVLFGLREAAQPVGQYEAAVTALNDRLAAAGPLLEDVGITMEAATESVGRAVGRLGEELDRGIQAELNRLTGRGAFNEISAIITDTEALAREYAAVGRDTGSLMALRDARLAEVLAEQSVEIVKEVSSAFGGVVAATASAELAARDTAAAGEQASAAADLTAQIEAMLRPAATAVGGVLERYDTLAAQAEALGLSFDLSGLRANDLAGAMARLDAEALQQVMIAYPKSAEVAEAATRALAGLSTTAQLAAAAEAEASRQRMQAIEDETRAASQAASAWAQIADQLDAARAGLRLAPSAALSPQLQLQETERQYQQALQQALSGDQDAAGRLPELARAMQEAGLSWFGPSSEFYGLQDQLQADLAEAAAIAGDQSSIAEQHLAVAQAQLTELQRIAGGGDAASNALTDWAALGMAVNAGTATGDVIGQQHAIIDRMDSTQLAVALQQAAPGGQAQQYIRQSMAGRGLAFDPAADAQARTAFTALSQAVTNGSASGDIRGQQREILSEMGPGGLMWALSQVNPQGPAAGDIKGFLRDYGVPGFRLGGAAGAGLAWVGESGPELVNLPRPAEIIDSGTSRRWVDAAAAMERGGSDHRMLELMQRLVDQNERLLRGSGRVDAEQIALLHGIRSGIDSLAGEANRAASRPRERVT